MINSKGKTTGIWLSEKALMNNMFQIFTLPEPELKCTYVVNGESEVINIMAPNTIFFEQNFHLKTQPYTIRVSYEGRNKVATFYLIEWDEPQTHILKILPKEGRKGNVYLRGGNFKDVGKVFVDCGKSSQKMKNLKEINYEELFPKRRPKSFIPLPKP
jgi:hypothetical protein